MGKRAHSPSPHVRTGRGNRRDCNPAPLSNNSSRLENHRSSRDPYLRADNISVSEPFPNSTAIDRPAVADLAATIELMQQQLDHLREQLTESQRLATIGTIAAVIAHEFNNILTPVV